MLFDSDGGEYALDGRIPPTTKVAGNPAAFVLKWNACLAMCQNILVCLSLSFAHTTSYIDPQDL